MPVTDSFPQWLKQRRQSMHLTQAQLAEQVGCATGMISKLESGERRPSREMAVRLAAALARDGAERAEVSRLSGTHPVDDGRPAGDRRVPAAGQPAAHRNDHAALH